MAEPLEPRPFSIEMYGIATLPFGVGAGFAQFALPFLLRRVGVPLEDIGKYVALCLAPSAYQFLWAPIVDLGPRRKYWLVLLSILGGLCLGGALLLDVRVHQAWFVDLAIAGGALTGLTGSCLGGLMATTLPDEVRGRAAGWSNAGNLGGAALGGGVIMLLSTRVPPPALAGITFFMVTFPTIAIMAIHEDARTSRSAAAIFGGMARSLGKTLKSRAGILGVLICISPVGTAALLNLFSGLGPDYHVSETKLTFITGFLGSAITAVGAFAGGYLSDRMPRRVAYLASGAVTAAVAFTMSFFPLNERSFEVGVIVYMFVAGFCYASFSAMVLEIVGQATESASTQYTLFTAASNQAIAYTTYLDGRSAKRWGVRGMLCTDAAANMAGIGFLAIVMLVAARLRPKPQLPVDSPTVSP
jgi:MFS family permease